MLSINSIIESPILSSKFLEKYKNKQPEWGFSGLGYIVYKRTYARELEDGSLEEWWQTIARCINGAQLIGANYTKEEAEKLFNYIFKLKGNFAGRMLWQLGTKTVERFGANSLLNCWFTSIKTIEDFCFLFENLMLGGGVGFSIKREDVHELPRIKKDVFIENKNTKDADFIVPDSREGWVKLLNNILTAYFIDGIGFSYSTILVRGAGEKISAFGGTASGPKILINGIENICNVLKSREGKKLRSIDALDICNIIGSIVVSGNVRRSAQIALGDPDDFLFLKAKRWDLGSIPNWRAMSNNTLYADEYDHILDSVWVGFEGNGEPYGFFNLPLAKKYGRLGEEIVDNCEGLNPCGEVTLSNKESCNLSELYLNRIENKEELIELAKLIFKTQKAICMMNFIHPETKKIVQKNMRIGLGVTGICQSLEKIEWLDDCYKELRKFDKQLSKEWGVNQSIKITTIKPSGTLSLLAGSTPGIHPGFSTYHIRRVRMASDDKLVQICRDLGYSVEYIKNFDGIEDHGTVIVSFPCKFDKNTIVAKDMSAIKQLELVKKLNTIWADNAVSVTVYYNKTELLEIKQWLKENYETSIKSVSFLLYSEHGFHQAPYEEIDEIKYNQIIKEVKSFIGSKINSGNEFLDLECVSGVCPIK